VADNSFGKDKIQGKCLSHCELVCKQKEQGGLGFVDLRTQNKTLLMNNLHKFYNHMNIPGVNLIWQAHYNSGQVPDPSANKGPFWWRDYLSLSDLYRERTNISTANGKS
jgi:hypothetical protein